MKTILHITTRREWEDAKRRGVYEAPSLGSEGFIHCSTAPQTVATANAYFRGVQELVLLRIDETATRSEVKYEPPSGAHSRPDELFPHLFGPLNLDAVIQVLDFTPRADGTFELPEGLVETDEGVAATHEPFDRVAALYDRARPGYPEQLFADLMHDAGLSAGARALEIGTGTGQATVPLARRGLNITCLEPGQQLARLAALNLRGYPAVRVLVRSFEDAELPGEAFQLVFSAQALHWVPRSIALQKSSAILAGGGALVGFWSSPVPDLGEVRDRIDEAYRIHAPAMPRWAARQDPGFRAHEIEPALRESEHFDSVWARTYRWTQRYTTAEYVELMQTHSDHQNMDAPRRDALLADIAAAIDSSGGTYDVTYETRLIGALRRG